MEKKRIILAMLICVTLLVSGFIVYAVSNEDDIELAVMPDETAVSFNAIEMTNPNAETQFHGLNLDINNPSDEKADGIIGDTQSNLTGLNDLALWVREYSDSPPNIFISLQGHAGSAEYMGAAEWTAILDSYAEYIIELERQMGGDQSLWPDTAGLDPIHKAYGASTQEHAEMLEEIAAKHDLSLFEAPHREFLGNEALFQAAGTDDFLGETNSVNDGYIFGRGTFQFNGQANFGDERIGYVLRNSQKGILDYVYINVWVDDFDEWLHETTCGTPVLIVSGKYISFIFADLNNSFVSIIINANAPHSAQTLESLADSIDFSILDM